MGRKSVVHSYDMLQDISPVPDMSVSFDSNITNVEQIDKLTIHTKWIAGPVGEFQLFARNGAKDPWYKLDVQPAMTITGTDDEIQILLQETPFTDIYLHYEATSGSSASVSSKLTMKVVGA